MGDLYEEGVRKGGVNGRGVGESTSSGFRCSVGTKTKESKRDRSSSRPEQSGRRFCVGFNCKKLKRRVEVTKVGSSESVVRS